MKQGYQIVILDNVVLDVKDFIKLHPGGRFVLEHNIGRDISKFFYGGYTLEGNLSGKSPVGYNHSAVARRIANSLIMARYEKDSMHEGVICRHLRRVDINATTANFTFSADSVVPNFKIYYPGMNTIAKHFLVRSHANKGVFRHYTVSNAMNPAVFKEYLRVL